MVQIQVSYKPETTGQGVLYLVPTPIGNLEDMTYRAIETLKTVDLIAAEDTRHSIKLCHYFEITTPLSSYHEHNKETSGYKLLEMMKEGKKIAIVTDAGMPGISDPGYELVKSCVEVGIPVIPLPGPNAALTALVASGLPTDHFYFYGFLPRQSKERGRVLEELKKTQATLIFYEAPHRLKSSLQDLAVHFPERSLTIGRELTKRYETFVRGKVKEVAEWVKNEEVKGECCLILQGRSQTESNQIEEAWWQPLGLKEHIVHYIEKEKVSSKEAIKKVALDRNLPKREVYHAFHVEEDE